MQWSTHIAVCCDSCDQWVHIKCGGITPRDYQQLSNTSSSVLWFCTSCDQQNDSVFDTTCVSSENSFATLSECSVMDNTSSCNIQGDGEGEQQVRDSNKIPTSNQLKIMVVNCCSIQSQKKATEFQALIDTEQLDVVLVSHLDATIYNSEVFPPGYDVLRKDRDRHGGGVFIMAKTEMLLTPVSTTLDNCEIVWGEIHTQCRGKVILGSIYRPPDSTEECFESIDNSLTDLRNGPSLPTIILAGDCNLPDIEWDTVSVNTPTNYSKAIYDRFIGLMDNHHLTQHVMEPTT